MTPLLAGLCFIGLGWLSFALARNVVATNSYESMKRDSRRFMGVICLLIGGVGIVGGINELLKPAPTVHKVVKRRKVKPQPQAETQPAETQPTEEVPER